MFRQHVIQQLVAYCHGELSEREARRVAGHLQRCPRCRAEYETVQRGISLARELPRASAPAALWDRIEVSLEHPAAGPARRDRSFPRRLAREWRAAAALGLTLLLALAGVALWPGGLRSPASWKVAGVAGAPTVGRARIRETGRLKVGDWLVTDGASRARLDVAGIGHVEVEPNTRLRLLRTRVWEHRLQLARGTLHASIAAPPRLFFIETPSAVAVDMGCAYTLEVDDAGRSLLRVTAGWVAFERDGRESFVPAGAVCRTQPGIGPGTPYLEDAPPALQRALARLDFEGGSAGALDVVLAHSRGRDALTLWHLLQRLPAPERARVYDRLAVLVPPSPGVTREGVLRLDREMLHTWKGDIEESWWE